MLAKSADLVSHSSAAKVGSPLSFWPAHSPGHWFISADLWLTPGTCCCSVSWGFGILKTRSQGGHSVKACPSTDELAGSPQSGCVSSMPLQQAADQCVISHTAQGFSHCSGLRGWSQRCCYRLFFGFTEAVLPIWMRIKNHFWQRVQAFKSSHLAPSGWSDYS